MASQTVTYTFNRNNFTSDSPSWSGPSEQFSSNLRFNTITQTLKLNNTNYSRGKFTVGIPSGVDLGLITFSTPNGSIVSISDVRDSVYELCNFQGSPIAKIFTEEGSPSSGNKIYYVIINGDPNSTTQYLNISIALAKEGGIPSANKTVDLTYDCSTFETLNKTTVGLHAYSAYDAKAGSSDLTTNLYSATSPGSWGYNTVLYSSPYFNNPALPYFYGYNGKVYRVGDPWSRSYGIKFRYEVRVTWHWFLKRRVRSKRVTLGPMETLDLGTNVNQPTSEACIEPTMRNVGKIRKVYSNDSTIPQPQQYRYYLGYDASNQRNSNDSVFTTYSLPKKKHFPITGLMHVLQKHTRGIINGFNSSWDGDVNWTAIAGGAGLGLISSIFGESIISGVANFFSNIPGPLPSFTALFGQGAAAALSTVLVVLAVLFILWKLISFFSPKTHHYRENCKKFLHHFTSTPYINTTDVLYRDDDLSITNNGHYCDGVYYYRQTGGSITSKTLSSTSAWVTEDEPFQFLYSLKADDPTLVEEWQKLILLPYTSGKPIPYCGGSTIYYSAERTYTVNTQCCALEDCNTPIVISLPYGSVTSCISQTDADDEAEAQFQSAIDYAEDHSIYNITLSDELIGQLDVNFTHEIKEEDNPTSMALYFDNRSGSDAPVGTPLYYDFTGCQKALPGYYAVSSSNYPKHYYKVEDGEVAAIYTQSAANATVTTTGQSIIKTNEDKSSNWYLKSNLKDPLYSYIANQNDRTFDVTSLITNSNVNLSAGRIVSGSYTDGDFEKYASFNGNGITSAITSEQGTGWYAPLNPWKPEPDDLFFYQNDLTSWTGGNHISTSGSSICSGGNTGNTYYHDGNNNTPSLGDRIFDSNDITDSTSDGYIKYTTQLYMSIVNGIMVDSTTCVVSTDFSGSIQRSNIASACNSSTFTTLYTHDGNTSYPEVGDTVSVYGGSAVSNGFINTSIGVLQTDDDGQVVQIIDCSESIVEPLDLTVGYNAILNGGNQVWYGYVDPNNMHLDPSQVSGDAQNLVGSMIGADIVLATANDIEWNLITWLGWHNNYVYLCIRKTGQYAENFRTMNISTDINTQVTHQGGTNNDWGMINATNNKLYISGTGNEGYGYTIPHGCAVTGNGIPSSTYTSGPAQYNNFFGRWEINVNKIITYSSVSGQTLTFFQNDAPIIAAYSQYASPNYGTSYVTDDANGNTADYKVYKWAANPNPFQYNQVIKVNFTLPIQSP